MLAHSCPFVVCHSGLYTVVNRRPHRGHLAMIRQYALMADEVKVIVSPLSRKSDGIDGRTPVDFTSEHSMNIWRKYIDAYGLTKNVKVSISPPGKNSPVKAAIDFAANENNEVAA